MFVQYWWQIWEYGGNIPPQILTKVELEPQVSTQVVWLGVICGVKQAEMVLKDGTKTYMNVHDFYTFNLILLI